MPNEETAKRLDKLALRLEKHYGHGCIEWRTSDFSHVLTQLQERVVEEYKDKFITQQQFIDDSFFLQSSNFDVIKAIGQKR